MRLNKYIAQSGLTSRRKADELIENGNVKVNGRVVTELGIDVQPDDTVEVNGSRISIERRMVYYMLNKPVGYVTTLSDEKDRPIVTDLLTDVSERVFPVGRLDVGTSGLLLMTNDGDLANKLMHPSHEIYKTYRAEVSGFLSDERINRLRKGVDIGGFITSPAKVKVVRQGKSHCTVEIQICEGKYRQVRRMFKAVGSRVLALQRVAEGELYLGRLMEGHYRKLTPEEVTYLKNL
jgi:23S rRNA pseudouridine2605 synthase